MIYPYSCRSCGKYIEIIKPSSDAGAEEHCEDCSSILTRIYTPPAVRIKQYITNRKDFNEQFAIAKSNGCDPVPLDPDFKPKKQEKSYEPTASECREIGAILDG